MDDMKRKTPRPQNLTVYLGLDDQRLKRIEKLDEIARKFGLNRSQLIVKIADGEIEVTEKAPF